MATVEQGEVGQQAPAWPPRVRGEWTVDALLHSPGWSPKHQPVTS